MEKLSLQLRQQTAARHQAAEGSSILTLLFEKTLEKQRYLNYLRSLHVIYGALEQGLGDAGVDPSLSKISFPEIFRLSALESDLVGMGGNDWEKLPVPDAAKSHGDHLQRLFAKNPHRVAAHAYVRYLGDLSGGQMIGKAVAASYGAAHTAFYEFAQVPDINIMKQRFREGLDTMPLSESQQAEVVEEACHAFDLTGALLAQL